METKKILLWGLGIVFVFAILMLIKFVFATPPITFYALYKGNISELPDGWSCASCQEGDEFYNRFIMIGDSFSAGGSDTHTHSALVSCGNDCDGICCAGVGDYPEATSCPHSHSVTYSFSTESRVPPYYTLYVIKYEGYPRMVPKDTVLFYNDSNSTPLQGWNFFSDANGYFIRGSNSVGETGGSSSHSHTVNINLATLSGSWNTPATSGTVPLCGTHGHTATANTNVANHTPPYTPFRLIFAQEDTLIPEGAIAFFNSTPSSLWGWEAFGTTGNYFQRLVMANSTYGTFGGSATHTHADINGIESTACNVLGAEVLTSGITAGTSLYEHTHLCDVTNINSVSNYPAYRSAFFAKFHYQGWFILTILDLFSTLSSQEGNQTHAINFTYDYQSPNNTNPCINDTCQNITLAVFNFSRQFNYDYECFIYLNETLPSYVSLKMWINSSPEYAIPLNTSPYNLFNLTDSNPTQQVWIWADFTYPHATTDTRKIISKCEEIL